MKFLYFILLCTRLSFGFIGDQESNLKAILKQNNIDTFTVLTTDTSKIYIVGEEHEAKNYIEAKKQLAELTKNSSEMGLLLEGFVYESSEAEEFLNIGKVPNIQGLEELSTRAAGVATLPVAYCEASRAFRYLINTEQARKKFSGALAYFAIQPKLQTFLSETISSKELFSFFNKEAGKLSNTFEKYNLATAMFEEVFDKVGAAAACALSRKLLLTMSKSPKEFNLSKDDVQDIDDLAIGSGNFSEINIRLRNKSFAENTEKFLKNPYALVTLNVGEMHRSDLAKNLAGRVKAKIVSDPIGNQAETLKQILNSINENLKRTYQLPFSQEELKLIRPMIERQKKQFETRLKELEKK